MSLYQSFYFSRIKLNLEQILIYFIEVFIIIINVQVYCYKPSVCPRKFSIMVSKNKELKKEHTVFYSSQLLSRHWCSQIWNSNGRIAHAGCGMHPTILTNSRVRTLGLRKYKKKQIMGIITEHSDSELTLTITLLSTTTTTLPHSSSCSSLSSFLFYLFLVPLPLLLIFPFQLILLTLLPFGLSLLSRRLI